ncbi:MAG TPA: methyl-accepting chemotaxis protein [Trichocoleus sp.]|jgi:methyl-accepting chemotaxis protein
MKSAQNLKLRHWIIAGYAAPLLGLLLSAAVTILNIAVVNEKSARVSHSQAVKDQINELAIDVQSLSRATRGYLLDKNLAFLNAYEQSEENLTQQLQQLDLLIQDTHQRENFDRLRQLLNEARRSTRGLIDLVSANRSKESIARWKEGEGTQQVDKTNQLIKAMQALELQIMTTSNEQQQQALTSLKTIVLLATGISLLVSAIIGYWVISRTANQMNEAASSIATATTEIVTTVEQQERTAMQQAASISETTTTMDELGASSRQSSEQAEAAASGAKQALSLAGSGTKTVERTLNGMSHLKQKVGAIADQILRLSEQTSQIGNISNLVSDLANQTNMLALNAAVEAVRAGEHGKGFAVVASEIRKLADQSRSSAERIGSLVTDIQNAINSTVMVTDEGTKTVDEGVQLAQETSDSFYGVTEAVNNVVLNSQQISLNVKQQSIAVQQVVDAMNALNIAARETASGVSQIKVGTQRLNEAALDLKEVV